MDKRNHAPPRSFLVTASKKLPSHYLTALHPDLPPSPQASTQPYSALFPHRRHSPAEDHLHLCLQLMLLPAALALSQARNTCPKNSTLPVFQGTKETQAQDLTSSPTLLPQHGISNKIFVTHKPCTLPSPTQGVLLCCISAWHSEHL